LVIWSGIERYNVGRFEVLMSVVNHKTGSFNITLKIVEKANRVYNGE